MSRKKTRAEQTAVLNLQVQSMTGIISNMVQIILDNNIKLEQGMVAAIELTTQKIFNNDVYEKLTGVKREVGDDSDKS